MHDYLLWSFVLLAGWFLAIILMNRGRVAIRWFENRRGWKKIEPTIELLDEMN